MKRPRQPGSHTRNSLSASMLVKNLGDQHASSTNPYNAPVGLEQQYKSLYTVLSSSLRHGTNGVAMLFGPHGHGKSMVVERCLADLHHHRQQHRGASSFSNFFRIVKIDGLLVGGDNTAAAREMARQLTMEAALGGGQQQGQCSGVYVCPQCQSSKALEIDAERNKTLNHGASHDNFSVKKTESITCTHCNLHFTPPTSTTNHHAHKNPSSLEGVMSETSSFHSNVSLLNETFKRARADGHPVLIYISNVDALAAKTTTVESTTSTHGHNSGGTLAMSNHEQAQSQATEGTGKQILLYHLLDRATSEEAHLVVIASSVRLSLDDMLEKRVRSRAAGTMVSIKFPKFGVFDGLVEVLGSNLVLEDEGVNQVGICILDTEFGQKEELYTLEELLLGKSIDRYQPISLPKRAKAVQQMFRRAHALGKDVRWFRRVLTVACAMSSSSPGSSHACHKRPCLMDQTDNMQSRALDRSKEQQQEEIEKRVVIQLDDIILGLSCMGYEVPFHLLTTPQSSSSPQDKVSSNLDEAQPSMIRKSAPIYNNLRTRTLLDLSGSQLVILLAFKRLAAKDESSLPPPIKNQNHNPNSSNQDGGDNETESMRRMALEQGGYVRPITFARIYAEYDTTYASRRYGRHGKRASTTNTTSSSGGGTLTDRAFAAPDLYTKHTLYQSFLQLMQVDLIRCALDHCGGGAMQYDYGVASTWPSLVPLQQRQMRQSNGGGCFLLEKEALHVLLDLEEELHPLLLASGGSGSGVEKRLGLDCSTALRDWGLKRFR